MQNGEQVGVISGLPERKETSCKRKKQQQAQQPSPGTKLPQHPQKQNRGATLHAQQEQADIVIGKEKTQMVQCWRKIKQKRIILHGIEINVLFERGNSHPPKRKSEQCGEDGEHQHLNRLGPGAASAKGMLHCRHLEIPEDYCRDQYLHNQLNRKPVAMVTKRVEKESSQVAQDIRYHQEKEKDAGAFFELPQAKTERGDNQHCEKSAQACHSALMQQNGAHQQGDGSQHQQRADQDNAEWSFGLERLHQTTSARRAILSMK